MNICAHTHSYVRVCVYVTLNQGTDCFQDHARLPWYQGHCYSDLFHHDFVLLVFTFIEMDFYKWTLSYLAFLTQRSLMLPLPQSVL